MSKHHNLLSRTLLCGLFFCLGPILWASDGFGERFKDSFDPLSSDDDALGLKTSVPHVQVNEYTGKTTINLPGIQLGPINLELNYLAPNRKNIEHHDINSFLYFENYQNSPLGIGWQLDLGHLVAKQGHLADMPGERSYWEEVGYWQTGVGFTAFTRDMTFFKGEEWLDDCDDGPCKPNIIDKHFIDSNMRRITRHPVDGDPEDPFLGGPFYLLEPNGRRIKFEPTKVDLTPRATPADNEPLYFFYPTEVTEANGRVWLIEYKNGLMNNDRPVISKIFDGFGRELSFKYQTIENRDYLEKVALREQGSTLAPGQGQVQMRFEYQVADGQVYLKKALTAENYAYEIGIQDQKLDTRQPFFLVDQLRLPTGGNIALTYESTTFERVRRVEDFPCTDPQDCYNPTLETIYPTYLRVVTLEALGHTYQFAYRQESELVHYGQTQGSLGLEITTVTVQDGSKTYTRETKFYGVPKSRGQYITNLSNFGTLIGLPWKQEITYDGETLKEEWTYSSSSQNGGAAGGHMKLGGTAKTGNLEVPVKLSHTRDINGDLIHKTFSYNFFWNRYSSSPTGNFFAPSEVKTWINEAQNKALTIRRITHSAFPKSGTDMLSRDTDARFLPYFLDLESSSFLKIGSQTLKSRNVSYKGTTPLIAETRQLSGTDQSVSPDLRTRFTYYDSGPFKGLRRRAEIPNSNWFISYDNYRYGIPTEVSYPLGPKQIRTLNLDGTIATQTEDGVLLRFFYDQDKRLTQTQFPNNEEPEFFEYGAPGMPANIKNYRGNGSQIWSETLYDGFNRPIKNRQRVTPNLSGTIQEFVYDAFGNKIRDKDSTTGALARMTYDVAGRLKTKRIYDASNQEVAFKTYNYSYENGHKVVSEITKISLSADGWNEKETVTDMAGRLVKTSQREKGTLKKSTEFFYATPNRVFIKPILPDGTENRQVRSYAKDQLDRILEENHPELDGVIYHHYDLFGNRILNYGPEGMFRTLFDDLARPTSYEKKFGSTWVPLTTWTYDAGNNQLTRSTNGEVEITKGDFDAMTRTQRVTIEIPGQPAGPNLLEPAVDAVLTPGDLRLRWQTDQADAYEVRLIQGESIIWQQVLGAVAETTVPASALSDFGDYLWQVRAVTNEREPSQWSSRSFSMPCDKDAVLSTSELIFQPIHVGQRSNKTVGLRNDGDCPIAVTFDIDPDSSVFEIDGETTREVAPGGITWVKVWFEPSAPGTIYEADLKASFDNGAQTLVCHILAASEQAEEPLLVVEPADQVDFGQVEFGAGTTRGMTIFNGGTGTLTGTITLTSTQPVFSLITFSSNPTSQSFSVAEGETAFVEILFEAPAQGAQLITGNLNIQSNGGQTNVSLRAESVGPSGVPSMQTPNNEPLNFGEVALGGQAEAEIVIINNGENYSRLNLAAIQKSFSGAFAAQFQIGAGRCDHVPHDCSELQPGQRVRYPVTFSPQGEPGSRSATLNLNYSDTNEQLSFQLSGTTVRAGELLLHQGSVDNPIYIEEIDFGNVMINNTAQRYLMVSNTGGQSQRLRLSTGGEFTAYVQSASTPLAPGQTRIITVNFRPTVALGRSGYLDVWSDQNPSPRQRINLRGIGIDGAAVSIASSQDNFTFNTRTLADVSYCDVEMTINTGTDGRLTVTGTGDFENVSTDRDIFYTAGTYTLSLYYLSSKTGPQSGEICFQYNQEEPVCVPFTGMILNRTEIDGTLLDYNITPVGGQEDGFFTVTNKSPLVQDIVLNAPPGFQFSNGSRTKNLRLYALKSQRELVRFKPSQPGVYQGQVTATTDFRNTVEVQAADIHAEAIANSSKPIEVRLPGTTQFVTGGAYFVSQNRDVWTVHELVIRNPHNTPVNGTLFNAGAPFFLESQTRDDQAVHAEPEPWTESYQLEPGQSKTIRIYHKRPAGEITIKRQFLDWRATDGLALRIELLSGPKLIGMSKN